MGNFKPSKYQKAVYTFIQKCKGNAVVDAVAGSGKSTTIVNALKIIPANKRVLFLAFNKSIVEELKIKIGNLPNVDIKTLHSLGCSAIMKTFRSNVDGSKYLSYVNERIKSGVFSPTIDLCGEQKADWKSNILMLIDLARVNLISANGDIENVAEKHNLMLVDNEVDIVKKSIAWGENETDRIDFTDMVYFPNVKKLNLFRYDWVFIDECQDLNAAQRNLFLQCIKPKAGRFIAVGDPKQAIYGFSGADANSFRLLKEIPHTTRLPLSICYRCDSSIIDLAKSIVPQIEARPMAPAGEVNRDCKIEDVQDGDMILCRVTTPLVELCMKYISNGVKAYVKGRDIGENLINMIKKTNCKLMQDVFSRFHRERGRIIGKIVTKTHCSEAEARENNLYKVFEDKIKAIEIISSGLEKSSEVVNRIESIFKDDQKSGICLSTIHKAKGLESDRVFIIREDKMLLKHCIMVPWMAEQEYNLVYVAYTRAKHFLGFIK